MPSHFSVALDYPSGGVTVCRCAAGNHHWERENDAPLPDLSELT